MKVYTICIYMKAYIFNSNMNDTRYEQKKHFD